MLFTAFPNNIREVENRMHRRLFFMNFELFENVVKPVSNV